MAFPPKATPNGVSNKRALPDSSDDDDFEWDRKDWILRLRISKAVEHWESRTTRSICVIKKILPHYTQPRGGSKLHMEVRLLLDLPRCNFIVGYLAYREQMPDPNHDTIFFQYYPQGDLDLWKKKNFERKNNKKIPESYLWRFLVQGGQVRFDKRCSTNILQMSQALAFIHGTIGPAHVCFLHRDIKPQNILVHQLDGTTYPSFKLHDFGCGTVWSPEKALTDSICGTFEWQPPETPMINTPAADVWSLGAVLHWLALGKAPIAMSLEEYAKFMQELYPGKHPEEAEAYGGTLRYYAAIMPRAVTPINRDVSMQNYHDPGPRRGRRYNHEYSEELNDWMMVMLHQRPQSRPMARDLIDDMIPEAVKMLKEFTRGSGGSGLGNLKLDWHYRDPAQEARGITFGEEQERSS